MKVHHVNELNRRTRERLCQAQELGQERRVGKNVVDRDCSSEEMLVNEDPEIKSKKARKIRDP